MIQAVEAAYRLDVEDDEWLRQLTDIVEPLLKPDTGIVSYFFDLTGPRTALQHPYLKRAELSRAIQEMPTFNDPAQRSTLMLASPVSTISQLLTAAQYRLWLKDNGSAMGIVDSLGLCALDPDGQGVVVSAGLMKPLRLEPKSRAQLARLSTHIGSAFRLRRHLAELSGGHNVINAADAVLTPSGEVAHARSAARQANARSLLRRAAKAADHARSRSGRRDPERALAAWKGMVDGRWSLVDQFDSDGRRFWLAHKNPPHAPDPRRLTARERQVLAYAAMGQSQKQIAYTLGISIGTVGNHLSAGMQKLGVRSRVELVRYFFGVWMMRAAGQRPARKAGS